MRLKAARNSCKREVRSSGSVDIGTWSELVSGKEGARASILASCLGANFGLTCTTDVSSERISINGYEVSSFRCAVTSDSVSNLVNPLKMGTVRAAIEHTVAFHSVTDDPAATMKACWSKGLNRAFKGVERITMSLDYNIKALVVVVVTNFANSHG
jgi:hypothetical protein